MLYTRTSTYRNEVKFFASTLQNQKSPSKKCANAYTYGFHSMEKDDEWKGITGADYDLEGYGYDARLGRRKSLDPKANQMPGWSGYSFGFNNPNYFIDPDGEFPWPFSNLLKRRKKPKIGNNIRGTGLIVLLGGTRGKYFKHNSLHKNNIPKPQPNDNFESGNVPKDPTARETDPEQPKDDGIIKDEPTNDNNDTPIDDEGNPIIINLPEIEIIFDSKDGDNKKPTDEIKKNIEGTKPDNLEDFETPKSSESDKNVKVPSKENSSKATKKKDE